MNTITLTVPTVYLTVENFLLGYAVASYFIVGLGIRFLTKDFRRKYSDVIEPLFVMWMFSPITLPIYIVVVIVGKIFQMLTGIGS